MPRTETDQPAIQADLIADYMHAHHPSWSIDTLLAHPTDALAFGLQVAVELQKIKPAEAAKIEKLIGTLNDSHGHAVSAIQSVCLAAINLRKRGHFNRRGEV